MNETQIAITKKNRGENISRNYNAVKKPPSLVYRKMYQFSHDSAVYAFVIERLQLEFV